MYSLQPTCRWSSEKSCIPNLSLAYGKSCIPTLVWRVYGKSCIPTRVWLVLSGVYGRVSRVSSSQIVSSVYTLYTITTSFSFHFVYVVYVASSRHAVQARSCSCCALCRHLYVCLCIYACCVFTYIYPVCTSDNHRVGVRSYLNHRTVV